MVTLEAMKMEAAVRAEIDGEVAEVLVQPGRGRCQGPAGGVAVIGSRVINARRRRLLL